MPIQDVLAVPGDLSLPTGGYHYDRSLLAALKNAGRDTLHISLPSSFPCPNEEEMHQAIDALADLREGSVAIVDGLAFGALETALLDRVTVPIVALVHHPLAHESGLPSGIAKRLYDVERANLEKSAHVIVPSEHIRDILVADYSVTSSRISVVLPGKPNFKLMERKNSPKRSPLILSVGLLHQRKGHDTLISALIACADLDWRAVIVGTPWEAGYFEELRCQIDSAGLTSRIELAGRVEVERLSQLYTEARIFALATRYEGYGIVFDEAFVHGLPVVATTAGAVPGTVPKDAGTLVPPDDAAAFADALRTLLIDNALHKRMSKASVRAGHSLPSWADAAEAVIDVLDQVRWSSV
jgi:glycosyltransferase involved in cell wall biosynthesis